jgi:hypothetical protein
MHTHAKASSAKASSVRRAPRTSEERLDVRTRARKIYAALPVGPHEMQAQPRNPSSVSAIMIDKKMMIGKRTTKNNTKRPAFQIAPPIAHSALKHRDSTNLDAPANLAGVVLPLI